MNWVATVVPDRPVKVLDIGGRDVNGTTRALFADGTKTTSVDIREGPCVDVVADVCDVDLGMFDVVVCTSVLEHAENWRGITAAAYRHLCPGGMFIMTCAGPGWPQHSAEDGAGLRPDEYYHNVSASEMADEMLALGFVNVDCTEAGESPYIDTRAVGWKP